MTSLELKLELPDRLARDAQAAGLLTPKGLSQLVRDAMRRRAAQTLLDGAARASDMGSHHVRYADTWGLRKCMLASRPIR